MHELASSYGMRRRRRAEERSYGIVEPGPPQGSGIA
jgi:hypothetical protein